MSTPAVDEVFIELDARVSSKSSIDTWASFLPAREWSPPPASPNRKRDTVGKVTFGHSARAGRCS